MIGRHARVMDTQAIQVINCLLFNSHVEFDRHVSVQACLRRLAAVIMPSPTILLGSFASILSDFRECAVLLKAQHLTW